MVNSGRGLEEIRSTNQEVEIFSNSFGGLNTLASPLNTPYEDAVDLKNMDVLISGVLQKRQGTRVVFKERNIPPDQVGGVTLVPFSTGLGYNFLVQKQRKNIRVYMIQDDQATLCMTKLNVWDDRGGDIRATYISTADIEPKLIFCTGVNRPVELKFTETSQQLSPSSTFNSIQISNDHRFANATTSNILVFQDRVLKTNVTSVSHVAGTTTITFGNNIPAGYYWFDVVLITWSWYAEAFRYYGDRFFKATTQLTSQVTGNTGLTNDPDQIISVPETLRDSIQPDSNFNYPIKAYKSTAYGDTFTLSTTREPQTSDEYAHSDGSPYHYAPGQKVNPSPLFITFGREFVPSSSTEGQARSVYLSRCRKLLFNGNSDIKGMHLKVYVNGEEKPQNLNATTPSAVYGSYYLRQSPTAAPLTDSNTTGSYLDFEAATTIGVPADAVIELVNTEVKHIGTAANSTRSEYLDGAYKPIYGLGLFANYRTGSYPRNVSLYQGRLVFSGIPEQPLTCVFSNTFDSVTPGVNYNSFQIDDFTTAATDPLDITLSSQPDDIVRGLMEWQNNLFVLTRKAVFRISGNQSVLTQANKFSVFVSNIGLVNPFCVVKTDKSIVYLSDIGLFDLNLIDNNSEYTAGEKSIKIRNKFGITKELAYENLAWVAYDNVNRFVFVGLPVRNTTYTSDVLLVFNTFRESWTEYTTPLGFNAYTATSYVDRKLGINFLMGCSQYRDTTTKVPTDFILLKFGYEKYIDFAEHFTGTGIASTYIASPRSKVVHTTIDTVQEYPISRDRTGQYRGINTFPMTNVKDISVWLDNVELVFEHDWVKLPNGNIYLRDNPGSGKTLEIRLRRPVTDDLEGRSFYGVTSPQNYEHEVVFVDNILQIPNSNYITSEVGDNYQITLTAPAQAVVVIGQAYPCLYVSPMFTQRTFTRLKRIKHLYAYFSNDLSQETYTTKEVNTAAGQSPEQLVGRPKVRQNVSVAIRLDEDDNTEVVYDLFGYAYIVWDDALFDINPPTTSFRRHALFKEAISGMGYSYQLLLWSFDESAFTFSGYQISAPIKGERYINWTK